jgi:hypothetical protein
MQILHLNKSLTISSRTAPFSIAMKRGRHIQHPRPSSCHHLSAQHPEHTNGVCYACTKNIINQARRQRQKEQLSLVSATPAAQVSAALRHEVAGAISTIAHVSTQAMQDCADAACTALEAGSIVTGSQHIISELGNQLTELSQLTANKLAQMQLTIAPPPPPAEGEAAAKKHKLPYRTVPSYLPPLDHRGFIHDQQSYTENGGRDLIQHINAQTPSVRERKYRGLFGCPQVLFERWLSMCRTALEEPRKRRKKDGPSRVKQRSCKLTTPNRFALGLFSITHGCPDLVSGEMFNVSQTTAYDECKHARKVIQQHVPIVQLPSMEEIDDLCRLFPGQHMVFAALDITESERARVLEDELEWHSGKLGAASMMTILLIDGRGRPLAWETGIRGHNNDCGAYQESKTYEWVRQLNRARQQQGKEPVWVLGDGGFPGCQWVRIPTRLANIKTREEREEVRQHSRARVIVENGYAPFKRLRSTDYTRRSPATQEEIINTATLLVTQRLVESPLRKPQSARTPQEQKNYEYNLHKKQQIRFERKVSSQTKKLKEKQEARQKERRTEEIRMAKLDEIEALFEQDLPVLQSAPAAGWQDRLISRKSARPWLSNFEVSDYLSALVPIPCQANDDHQLAGLRRTYETVRRLNLDKINYEQLQQGIEAYLRQVVMALGEQEEQAQLRSCWQRLCTQMAATHEALLAGLPEPQLFFYVLLEHEHFRLFVVNLHTNELEFYDSLGGFQMQDALASRSAIQWCWRTFFARELAWRLVTQRKSQLNGSDCGVFTALYAFLRMRGWTPDDIHKKLYQRHATAFRRHMHAVFTNAHERTKPTKIINPTPN